jgi:hypothetical protein
MKLYGALKSAGGRDKRSVPPALKCGSGLPLGRVNGEGLAHWLASGALDAVLCDREAPVFRRHDGVHRASVNALVVHQALLCIYDVSCHLMISF